MQTKNLHQAPKSPTRLSEPHTPGAETLEEVSDTAKAQYGLTPQGFAQGGYIGVAGQEPVGAVDQKFGVRLAPEVIQKLASQEVPYLKEGSSNE